MSKYQMRDVEDRIVAEESFGSFEEANAWATMQDVRPGWTLFQRMGDDWIPARHDPSPD